MEDARIKRQACLSVAEFTQEIVDNIGIVGVPFLAGILYFRGQVAFGAIIAAGYLANGVFSSLQESFSAYISAKSTTKLNETMLQHLQVQAAAKTEDPQTIIGRGTEVNLGGQVIKYPDLDFTIKAGEKVLLTGPSGCGKSSLFKLLLGQIEPSKGQLTYLDSEGKEIQNPARSFEYLPQAGWIFPGTVADNITMYDAKKQTKLAEVLKKVGLDRDFSKAVDLDREVSPQQADLSGGQKQKIFLARGLLRHKKFSLMDEPLSALDQASRQKILPLLLGLKQTLIFVGHNLPLEERERFDQVINLKEGENFAN
ncbi:ATP-binding cassette domain-containing protein [Lactobacillus delbrueckii]|uniref:ATP-binding cassette domain-containing protein n=1 Tax=Lactobacillus delbrueckii TaxID=1584 RepID=UPI0002DF95EF|nr:ABC transporter ATP-binding protein [Lactobacillus delbrueckii]